MNSKIQRSFPASWRFSLNLISCFIDLWDSLNTAKGKVWACQRGCQETIHDGKQGTVCPQEEFLVPAGQSRAMGTFTANLGSSLIIRLICPFFRSARTGTGCSSLSKEQEVPPGAPGISSSSPPDAELQSFPDSSCPMADFPIPQVVTNHISCARAAPSGSGVISLLYDLERKIWFFPMHNFAHTPLYSALESN